ncbi:MAG TPA: hypothetical protein DCX71_15010 [Erythrobacter sp.]|nr:hypothetical protein CHH26_03895 [Qipengyuania flava]HAW37359.1 hypothetical protein [Erythrobacter sp.]
MAGCLGRFRISKRLMRMIRLVQRTRMTTDPQMWSRLSRNRTHLLRTSLSHMLRLTRMALSLCQMTLRLCRMARFRGFFCVLANLPPSSAIRRPL